MYGRSDSTIEEILVTNKYVEMAIAFINSHKP